MNVGESTSIFLRHFLLRVCSPPMNGHSGIPFNHDDLIGLPALSSATASHLELVLCFLDFCDRYYGNFRNLCEHFHTAQQRSRYRPPLSSAMFSFWFDVMKPASARLGTELFLQFLFFFISKFCNLFCFFFLVVFF